MFTQLLYGCRMLPTSCTLCPLMPTVQHQANLFSLQQANGLEGASKAVRKLKTAQSTEAPESKRARLPQPQGTGGLPEIKRSPLAAASPTSVAGQADPDKVEVPHRRCSGHLTI